MHLIRSMATAYANGHRSPAAQIPHGPGWAGWRLVEGKWAPASVFQLTQPTNGRWGVRTSTSLAGPRHSGRPLRKYPGHRASCRRADATSKTGDDGRGIDRGRREKVAMRGRAAEQRDAGSNLIDETQKKKNGEERAGNVLVWDAGMDVVRYVCRSLGKKASFVRRYLVPTYTPTSLQGSEVEYMHLP